LAVARNDYGDRALYPERWLCIWKPSLDESCSLSSHSCSVDGRNPLRQKTNFPSPFNPITPVQISRQKYSALRFPQISRTLSPIPPHAEGRFAIVTNVEAGSGGRDGSQAFLTPTNELIRLRGDRDGPVPGLSYWFSHKAFADGQAVWSWRPDAGAKLAKTPTRFASDGGKRARSPRRARSKPSNHRAGKAGCSG
jgi:hypothetical protein